MELHGFADLLQHKLAFGFQIVAGQALGAASNQDWVKMHYANALGKFVQHQVKTMVEAPDDRGVGFVSRPWRVEMEDLANKAPRVGTLYRRIGFGRL
jgi:hypothetical protein